MNIDLPPTVHPELPNDATALLRLPGPQFIEALYGVLLGREPDPDGRVFFRRRLLEGVSKLQITAEFATSPEAKARGAHLPGLDELLRHADTGVGGWRHRLQQILGLSQDRQAAVRRDSVLQATLDELAEDASRSAVAQQQRLEALNARMDRLAEAHTTAIESGNFAATALSGDLRTLAANLQRLQSDVDRLAGLALPPRGAGRATGSTPLERLSIARRAGI